MPELGNKDAGARDGLITQPTTSAHGQMVGAGKEVQCLVHGGFDSFPVRFESE